MDYESYATALNRNELGADIPAIGSERGHRTRTVLRRDSKIVTIPLAPRIARSPDLAIGERCDGRSSAPTAGGWTATAPVG